MAEPKAQPFSPSEAPLEILTCSQDGYTIVYAPDLGEATYIFETGERLDVTHLTKPQVAYLKSSGYWTQQ